MLLNLVAVVAFATDPISLNEAWHKSHPSYSVDVTAKYGNAPTAKIAMLVQYPRRLKISAKVGPYSYLYSSTEDSYTEIEHSQQLYDVRPRYPFGIVDSRILPQVSHFLPMFSVGPNLNKAIPSPQFEKQGNSYKIKGHAITKEGEVYVDATVASDGSLTRYSSHVIAMGTDITSVFNFTSYKSLSGLSLQSFATPLPLGYMPYSLPDMTEPLQKDEQFPLNDWIAPQSKKKVNLGTVLRGKVGIIALLSATDPSKRSRSSLHTLSSSLPVIYLSDGQGKVDGAYTDPSGSKIKSLKAPATPMFWLVDGKGKILKLWMGYDSAKAKAFESDVLEAAKGS